MVHVTVETVYETTTTAALGAQRRARGLRRRRLCNTLYVGSGAAREALTTLMVAGDRTQRGC